MFTYSPLLREGRKWPLQGRLAQVSPFLSQNLPAVRFLGLADSGPPSSPVLDFHNPLRYMRPVLEAGRHRQRWQAPCLSWPGHPPCLVSWSLRSWGVCRRREDRPLLTFSCSTCFSCFCYLRGVRGGDQTHQRPASHGSSDSWCWRVPCWEKTFPLQRGRSWAHKVVGDGG